MQSIPPDEFMEMCVDKRESNAHFHKLIRQYRKHELASEHDRIGAKETQATPEAAFDFHAPLTSKCPAKAGHGALKVRTCE